MLEFCKSRQRVTALELFLICAMQGRPIYIQHLGQVNIKKIYEITTEERMLKFHVQEYERCIQYIMPACSKVAGKHIEQTFAILDVKGIHQHHAVCLVCSHLYCFEGETWPKNHADTDHGCQKSQVHQLCCGRSKNPH